MMWIIKQDKLYLESAYMDIISGYPNASPIVSFTVAKNQSCAARFYEEDDARGFAGLLNRTREADAVPKWRVVRIGA